MSGYCCIGMPLYSYCVGVLLCSCCYIVAWRLLCSCGVVAAAGGGVHTG